MPGSSNRVARLSGGRAGSNPEPLRDIASWLERYKGFLGERYDRLDEYLRELQDTGEGAGRWQCSNWVTRPRRSMPMERSSSWSAPSKRRRAGLEGAHRGRADPALVGAAQDVDDRGGDGRPRRRQVALGRPLGRRRCAVHGRISRGRSAEASRQHGDLRRRAVQRPRARDRDADARRSRRQDEARSRSVFPSAEVLEGALATGMVGGAIELWDRLAEEIASI